MALPKGIVEDLQSILRYDITSYLNSYVTFISSHRKNIFDYYSGNTSKPNEISFKSLRLLIEHSKNINDLLDIHRESLRKAAFWEISELLTVIFTSLQTVDNSSKWMRSAITKNNFSLSVETLYSLNKLQTLERVSGDILGSSNRDQDWMKLALRNDLKEEDYTTEGGTSLKIAGTRGLTLRLFSVVDNISEEKVYGIDLNRKITFADEDLQALGYRETIRQAITINGSLKQGDTPEFPQNGIQANLIIGSNARSVSYPVLVRQLYNTFNQDDTMKSLSIQGIELIEDSLQIAMSVETRLGDEFEENITL